MDQRYAALQAYAQENTYEDDYGETYTNLSDDEIISLQQEAASLKEQFEESISDLSLRRTTTLNCIAKSLCSPIFSA